MRLCFLSLLLFPLILLAQPKDSNSDEIKFRWKLSPNILQAEASIAKENVQSFLIKVNNCEQFIAFTKSHNSEAKIIYSNAQLFLFRVKCSYAFMEKNILPLNAVINVDARFISPKEETVITDFGNEVNEVNQLHAVFPGYNGENETVSIKENFFDTTDIDFKNRITLTNLNSTTATAHATIMATLIAGGGNSFYTGRGVAWSSKIASSDFAVLLPDLNSSYLQYGITVQNHSYGVGIENFYGSDAAAYDTSMLINNVLIHVFSAGNVGTQASTSGKYAGIQGYANLTGSFKMSKNILTVGSVDSFYNVAVLSSKGPAYDGRVKPELVAYGNDGSSGAAAITSGTILAMQDAYSKSNAGNFPANALMKAVIINSADDVGSKGIDFISGYGCVNAYNAVEDIINGKYFSGAVTQNETADFIINAPANVKNLKVTLVWDDLPAQPNAETALVNDLDLSVEKKSTAQIWLPYVLNSAPDKDSLQQLPTQKKDTLNVVEQTIIPNVQQGEYIVHVNGFRVQASQKFYVAYRWDTTNTFKFTFPLKEDHFTAAAKNVFRWRNFYTASSAKLEYSINNGASWKLIDAAADVSKPYYTWNAPDTNVVALARVTINGETFITDTFNISKQVYTQVGFNCPDSVLIYWNKAKGINSYEIFSLGEKYLQHFTTVNDTSIIIHSPDNLFYAVAPILSNGKAAVKSYTFNYTTQGVACYIKNFLADLDANSAVLLFQLGSLYNVQQITFQKLTANGWIDLQAITPVTALEYNYTDQQLTTGLNTYRVLLQFNNGAVLASNQVTVYYASGTDFTLLPNPVSHTQKLTIVSIATSNNTFILYDATGRKVLQQILNNTREDISIAHLAKGFYIAVIMRDGKKVFSKKLMIQ